MGYIRDNFTQLTSRCEGDHPVSKLTSGELSLLLQDKYINVKSEDEVIDALMAWFSQNLESTEDRVLVDDIMRFVNWPFVSFERMMDLYRAFPRLRINIHTKGTFHHQIKYRATKSKSPNV